MELLASLQHQSRHPTQISQGRSERMTSPPTYSSLSVDSLRAVSMENGVQYTAIYWETGHRTWLPFWASLSQKFTWKIIDDQVDMKLQSVPLLASRCLVFHEYQGRILSVGPYPY